jgi:hypothetical protein
MSKVSLHLFKATQVIWAFALILFVAPLIERQNELSLFRCLVLISLFGYAIASFGLYLDSRWAWIVSLVFLAAYWILFGVFGLINFVVNFYMFFTGHKLYRDSPMTIGIVIINAIFGILPAGVLLILGIISRRHILEAIKGRHEMNTQMSH